MVKHHEVSKYYENDCGLVWKAALIETKVKLNLLTDIDMSLMVEKGIRGGICHSIYQYVKANNK